MAYYEALDQWERSNVGAGPMRAKPGYISPQGRHAGPDRHQQHGEAGPASGGEAGAGREPPPEAGGLSTRQLLWENGGSIEGCLKIMAFAPGHLCPFKNLII